MANSVSPDQMPHSVASDLGLHCLQRPAYPNTRVFMVMEIEIYRLRYTAHFVGSIR